MIGSQARFFARANGKLRIFRKDSDFLAFEKILAEGTALFSPRLCGYCIMGNHWHLLLWPQTDGDLSRFMRWVTLTHTQRYHTSHATVGIGHLYQGRYKSFPVQSDLHYLKVLRYIEANPLRAGLVREAGQWPWSSLRGAPGSGIRRGLERWSGGIAGALGPTGACRPESAGNNGHREQYSTRGPVWRCPLGNRDGHRPRAPVYPATQRAAQKKYLTPLSSPV